MGTRGAFKAGGEESIHSSPRAGHAESRVPPFYVQLRESGNLAADPTCRRCEPMCGGVVIRLDRERKVAWILTAAHCLEPGVGVSVWWNDGTSGSAVDSPSWHAVPPSSCSVFRHPGFSERTMRNDVALVAARVPAEAMSSLRPIALPPPRANVLPAEATVYGYSLSGGEKEAAAQSGGDDGEQQADPPATLYSARVRLEARDHRQRISSQLIFDPRWHVWAVGEVNGSNQARDTCAGDSGGPMTSVDRTTLLAITSWGISCGEPEHPGVYALVHPYVAPVSDPSLPHARRLRGSSPWRKGIEAMVRDPELLAFATNSSSTTPSASTTTSLSPNPWYHDPPRPVLSMVTEAIAGDSGSGIVLLLAVGVAAMLYGLRWSNPDHPVAKIATSTGLVLLIISLLVTMVTYC